MSRFRHILLSLMFCLLPLNAGAQPGPILVVEHDWRFFIGGKSYGVWQSSLKGDPTHWTSVYCGKHLFTVKMSILQLSAIALFPVAVLVLILRPRRTPSDSPHQSTDY